MDQAKSEARRAVGLPYDVGVDAVTAFVLAGGQSSRMGSDKSLLSLGDQTMLQRALQTVARVARRTVIVGSRGRYEAFGEVVEDEYAGCGPLGGVHAALGVTSTDLNLVLSVDMPLMTAGFLAWLLQQAAASNELVVVPDAFGGLQPLCAIYHRQVREVAEQALHRGEYKIARMFASVPTRKLGEQEIVTAGFSAEVFRNVNTFEEYEELVKHDLPAGK